MALFEIYNIDTWSGSEPTPSYVRLLPLVGTVLGFSLGLLPGLISREKFKRKTGQIFEYELKSLLITLSEQIEELKRYRNHFLDPKTKQEELLPLSISLLHKFEILRTLDKVILIKYYEKSNKELATHNIGAFYQMCAVVERDAERLDRLYTEYQLEFDRISASYFEQINSLRLLAIVEKDKLGGNAKSDIFLSKLWTVAFSKEPDFSISDIMLFAKELNFLLTDDPIFSDTKHALYRPVLDFSLRGSTIVNEYDKTKKRFLGILTMSEQTFQDAVDSLNDIIK